VWGEMDGGTGELRSYQVLSAFVSCSQQGRLPGCLYRFDDPDAQCIAGREGVRWSVSLCLIHVCCILSGRLCGTCSHNYGVTLDLQSCREDCVPGIVLFILLCEFSC